MKPQQQKKVTEATTDTTQSYDLDQIKAHDPMNTLAVIGLIILVVIIVIGIVRVSMRPSDSFIDFVMDIFLLDLLFDMIGGVFAMLGELFSE